MRDNQSLFGAASLELRAIDDRNDQMRVHSLDITNIHQRFGFLPAQRSGQCLP